MQKGTRPERSVKRMQAVSPVRQSEQRRRQSHGADVLALVAYLDAAISYALCGGC